MEKLFRNLNVVYLMKKILTLTGSIAPVFYFLLVTILGGLWTDYSPLRQHISELGSSASPFSIILNLGFMIFALLTIIFSICLKKEFEKNNSYIFLLIGGFFKFLTGIFPCDEKCINITFTGQLHTITTNSFSIFMPIAPIFLAPSLAKNKTYGKKWAYASVSLGIVSIISGILMHITLFSQCLGLLQRIKIGAPLLWMFIMSIKIYKKN
ncbi:MAG: DUF998 domain-containing protein [Candidatus Nanoarchaeia archaeon]|jgi:hypothetical membrane protein